MVAVMSQWCQGAAIVTHRAGSRAKAAGLGPCSVRPGEAWREQRFSCFSSSMPIMSKGTEEAPNSGEPVCVLCRRAQVNPDICGQTFANDGLCAHQFCLFFANGLLEWRSPMGGIFGFSINAVQRTVQLAEQKNCFVCGGRGAAITCAETGCERSFHLPCTEDGECITQYFGQHRSFCWEHRPRQAAEAAPSQNTSCVICLEPVGDSTSYHTMVCPVCKQAWFHRGCIRVGALPSPCGHGRCSAAPSPTHSHACASPAETCPARCHHAFLLPRLRRKRAIPIPNEHTGDPNSGQTTIVVGRRSIPAAARKAQPL
ncbi:PHD finger protein 7-like isoform X2 [Gallus gallus]|uniref:PHD finger protein 7-like isoform X2 n=1 Tax=Gallus gallus TaxID=9031 RepID=UPI001AE65E58|nr:PHD finger protein 7-like isoform X2 [Gallus gallus]XP_046793012.1 PHD finger protein 7-like isoform X2 [Gallus gallus]